MNEFNAELEKFIDETVKKAVTKYTLETNNQVELLTTAVNTLIGILISKRFPSTEELKAIMDKVLEEKAVELREKNFGEKSEEPKS